MIIKVCIPYYAEYEACKAGLRELQECKAHTFILSPVKGSVVAFVRNHLVNEGVSTKRSQRLVQACDGYLFIDSDIGFTLDDVLTLIEAKKPITALPYETYNDSGVYQVGEWEHVAGNIKYKYPVETEGWKRVAWVGGGMHLVMKHVYEKMEYPWYRHSLVQLGDNQEQTSEDLGFCIEAKKAGFNIWCNFDKPVKHTKTNN